MKERRIEKRRQQAGQETRIHSSTGSYFNLLNPTSLSLQIGEMVQLHST